MSDDRDHDRRPEPAPGRPPTADRLRDEIDSGRTHDKVAHSDPAAAPLGTDAEAAGTPPTEQQVNVAYAHETGRVVPDPVIPPDRTAERAARMSQTGMIWGLIVLAALIIIGLLVF